MDRLFQEFLQHIEEEAAREHINKDEISPLVKLVKHDYDGFIKVGFTPDQAFRLVLEIIKKS